MIRRRGSAPTTPAQGDDAIAIARRTIAEHSKSFALASRLLAPDARDLAAVVYTFCRRADDAIDLVEPAAQPAALAALRAEVDAVFAGDAIDDPVLAAFAETAKRTGMPRHYPDELLAGMEMDVLAIRYDDTDTLLRYCYRVAGTVGLMMSHVMGVYDPRALASAVHLGMAMQLTNICRDVVEDWNRDRLYVPRDVLSAHGGEFVCDRLGTALPARARRPLADAIRQLLGLAERLYRSGDRGLLSLPFRSAFGVRAARRIYSAIGRELLANDCDVFAGRSIVATRAKLAHVAVAAAQAAIELPGRARRRGLAPPSSVVLDRAGLPTIRFPGDVLPLSQPD